MKPIHLIESLKITYDVPHAYEVAMKMVKAAFPDIPADKVPGFIEMTMKGFRFKSQFLIVVSDWSYEDIVDFLNQYHDSFPNGLGDELRKFGIITALMIEISRRLIQVKDTIPDELPDWFKQLGAEIKKREAKKVAQQ